MRGAVQTHEDSGRLRSRRNPLCPQVLNESVGWSGRLRRVAAFSQFAPATKSEANPSTNDVAEARSVAPFFSCKIPQSGRAAEHGEEYCWQTGNCTAA